jgi:plasmid maintenance system antidote protein VapI
MIDVAFDALIVDYHWRRMRNGQATEKPCHPGEILLEKFLEPAGVTQAALVEKPGWTTTPLSELIKGKRGLTAPSALPLWGLVAHTDGRPHCYLNDRDGFDSVAD